MSRLTLCARVGLLAACLGARPLWAFDTIDHGEKVTEGTFDHCATHPAVVESYLGRDPDALAAE